MEARDVFISYAREDGRFAERLDRELTAKDRKTWRDDRIPKGAEWLAEIHAAIDSANVFLSVLSPDYLASSVCADELKHAVEGNKRLLPVVARDDFKNEQVDSALAKLNWIFFRESDDFDASLNELLAALRTDLAWVGEHTRLLVRAVEWDGKKRDTSYTLRGEDLKRAEDWMSRATDKEPKPTGLQTQYVLASRMAVTVRQRVTFGAVAFGLVVAVALSLVAYFQIRERLRQQRIALARQLINQAEALRDPPPNQPYAPERLEDSTRAAVQALRHFSDLGMYSVEADQAVREGMALLPQLVGEHDLVLAEINASAFTPSGRFLAVADELAQIAVWDTVEERQVAAWGLELPVSASVLATDISADGAHLATSTYDTVADASTLTIWQLPGGTPRARFEWRGRMGELRLNPTGEYVYASSGGSWRRWNVGSSAELDPPGGDLYVADLDFSPDGRYQAVALSRKGAREYVIRISDPKTGEEKRRWEEPGQVGSLTWTTDSKKILVTTVPPPPDDGAPPTVRLRDATTGKLEASYPQDGSGFVPGHDGRLIAERMRSHIVQVRSAASGREVFRVPHVSAVEAMAFRPDGDSVVTLSVDDKLRVWKLTGSRWVASLRHEDPITGVDFSADDATLLTGSVAGKRSWHLPAKNKALDAPRPSDHSGEAANVRRYQARVSVSPSPAGETNRVDVLNEKGERHASIEFPSEVLAAAVSRDGRRLAVATGNITRGGWQLSLESWDLDRRERLGAVPYPEMMRDEHAGFLAFSPDDRFIVTLGREGFTLWDAEKLAQAATIYDPAPRAIAFQPDGTLVATAGRDQNIRVWGSAGGPEVARVAETEPVKEFVLSPDGRWLATLTVEGVVRLWLLQPDDLIAQACARIRTPCP